MKPHCDIFDSHCGGCRDWWDSLTPTERYTYEREMARRADLLIRKGSAPMLPGDTPVMFPAIKKSDAFIKDFLNTLQVHRRFFIPTPDGKPYMERIALKETLEEKVYLHILYSSDGDRDPHDHPWDFTSRIIYGSYIEHTPVMDPVTGKISGYNQEVFDHVINNVNEKKAEQLHRLELPNGPVVTLVTRGPKTRRWGFYTDAGWQDAHDYIRAKGGNPDEEYE